MTALVSTAALPPDYADRVYAGILGKLIGVYLGRPFEGWTYQRIMEELGPIEYYVHDRLGQPLVVTDDDVAGTFTFLRALDDHGSTADLTAAQIGEAWLNYIIEHRTILWWGGNGNSTEHTAWLNLRKGIAAPLSGAIATNGATVAEQIGAQIFIDGWALVAPNRPDLAARLAARAASVSHDGEAVHAAVLWATMEAAAFGSADVDQLLDAGLDQVPADCLIARVIGDIRAWHAVNPDWQTTRQQIEETYGYAKFPGNCHVVPNHALMVMALLHAPDDFQRAQMIVNTSGWDTDCNAGNLGCLMGIMLGLEGIDAGPDFRGPIADRMLISSADGGFSINDAVRMTDYVVNLGRRLGGLAPDAPAKDGARFHFARPGSVQGFRPQQGPGQNPPLLTNIATHDGRALAFDYRSLGPGQVSAATTPTFAPPDLGQMRTYELMATPLVYPGQTVFAQVAADPGNRGTVAARLRLRVYGSDDRLHDIDGPVTDLAPGQSARLEWRLPDTGGMPVGEIGLALTATGPAATGRVTLDRLGWTGAPDVVLRRPDVPAGSPPGDSAFWRHAWVNAASDFARRSPQAFRIAQDRGCGMILHGAQDWTDYQVAATVTLHLGDHGGLVARAQGLRRYYALRLVRTGTVQIVRMHDGEVTVLAEAPFEVTLDRPVHLELSLRGAILTARADATELKATDTALTWGAIGLSVHEGALSTDTIRVKPLG